MRSQKVIYILILALMANAGTAFLTLSPILVGGMVDYLYATNEQAGLLVAFHLTGAAIGSFTCMLMAKKIEQRQIILLSVVCMIIGEVVFLFTSMLPGMFLGRLIAGLGAGAIVAIAAANVVSLKNKNAIYAFLLLSQMMYGFVGASFWQLALGSVGYTITMLSLPFLGILILPFIKILPTFVNGGDAEPISIRLPSIIGIFALSSLFLHYIANSSEWVYLERIGVEGGLDVETVSSALGVSMIFGMIGAICAIFLGQLKLRFIPIATGILGIIAGTSMLLTSFTISSYTFAVCIILMMTVFTIPFYQGFIADLENGEMMAMLGAGTINIGLAVGPMIGSQIVSFSGFRTMLILCIIFFVFSLILISIGLYRQGQSQ